MFFRLEPKRATLSDANRELIETYQAVRAYPRDIAKVLKEYQQRHCAGFYYEMRESRPRSCAKRAARFIYLNRVCWNGLYRVNLKGHFNVPMGTKTEVAFCDGFLQRAAELLRGARLVHSDFEPIIDAAQRGDFVYVDPPYTVAHNNNGFLKYNEVLFSWDDQVRLSDAIRRATARGVKVVVTNAAHQSVIDLYSDFATVASLRRNSVIAADSAFRGALNEVVFTTNC